LAEWCQFPSQLAPGRGRVKSAAEIMNILEAYDLKESLRDAAELAGCSHHTVARYVAERERGRAVPGGPARRPGMIDEFLPKLEELVERSKGKIRAGLRPLNPRYDPHDLHTISTRSPHDPEMVCPILGKESTCRYRRAYKLPKWFEGAMASPGRLWF
jgi:hypothetical protein